MTVLRAILLLRTAPATRRYSTSSGQLESSHSAAPGRAVRSVAEMSKRPKGSISIAPWNPKTSYGISLPGVTHDWARQWTKAHGRGPKNSKILLLKLHGSLGWAAYPNGAVKLKARPYYVRTGKYESISVLAPGWQKPIDRDPYRQLWHKARLRLQACKSLVIVGYSLPDTDLLARALFS